MAPFSSSHASGNYCCPDGPREGFEGCTVCTVTATNNCDDYFALPPETVQCPLTYPFFYMELDYLFFCCRCENHKECQQAMGAEYDNLAGVNAMMQENGTVDESKF